MSDGSFGVCSGDYRGKCERAPKDCSDEPFDPVCDCSGKQYDNACELRKTGYRDTILACPQ